MGMFMQHEIDMQLEYKTKRCSMDVDIQHGHSHAACTWTCSMDMDMQYGHGSAPWTLGCSDFHIFSQSYQVSPIPAFFRTLVFRKYPKKDCHFCHLGRIFFYFFKNLYFFRNFQNQFSKSVFKQSLRNF
jgi:hypothetical protein